MNLALFNGISLEEVVVLLIVVVIIIILVNWIFSLTRRP